MPIILTRTLLSSRSHGCVCRARRRSHATTTACSSGPGCRSRSATCAGTRRVSIGSSCGSASGGRACCVAGSTAASSRACWRWRRPSRCWRWRSSTRWSSSRRSSKCSRPWSVGSLATGGQSSGQLNRQSCWQFIVQWSLISTWSLQWSLQWPV